MIPITQMFGLVALLTWVTSLWAQVPDSVFKPASSWRSGMVSLDSPFPLDLPAIARVGRPDFSPANPDTSLIHRFYDENYQATSIPYEAPLPAKLPTGYYWVLTDSGATEVYLDKIEGTIYMNTEPPAWPVNELMYFGRLVGRPAVRAPIGEPHFGFFSPQPIRIRADPATIGEAKGQPVVRALLNGRRLEVPLDSVPTIRNSGPPSRARAFEILETGQVYLSVAWPGDDICAGEYLLYAVTANRARPVEHKMGPCGE